MVSIKQIPQNVIQAEINCFVLKTPRTFALLHSMINDNFIQIPSHFPMEFPAKGLTNSPETQYKSQQRDLHS